MNRTSIEWTDFSANPLKFRDAAGKVVWACVHASPGCQHCYAETLAKRYGRGGPFSVPTTNQVTPFLDEKELRQMLTHKPASGKRCFVGDMTDIFGEWVPDDLLDRLFTVFTDRPDVTWQVLTKRAARMRDYLSDGQRQPARWPLPNVWLGVSCEDQQRADERIPLLLQTTAAAVRFVSAEPLLGPISFARWPGLAANGPDAVIDWVIVGGESGPKSRRCDRAWIESIVRQCRAARAPVFVKQFGSVVIDRNDAGFMGDDETEWPEEIAFRDAVEHNIDGYRDEYQGAPVRVHLKSRKGGDPSEWPESLRVREFPRSAAASAQEPR